MAKASKNPGTPSAVLARVAELANVSQGTVSRVFNNSSLIPSETRSTVLDAARELGFRPRIGVRTKQIALVTEAPHKTVMGGYVNTMTQHICFALSKANAGIAMITEDRIDDLKECWFDGIIGIAWEEHTLEILKSLKNIPIIWLSDNFSDVFQTIYVDPLDTGKMAGEYLCSKGHRKIAIIHDVDYIGNARAEGLAYAMSLHGARTEEMLVRISNKTPLHLAVKQLIDASCTAVWVTGEDMKVLEVNWLIQELAGKKIPDDISLLGFENPGISEFQRPSLSTIASPLKEMAELAVKQVLRDDLNVLERIKISCRLIERNSVSALKKK